MCFGLRSEELRLSSSGPVPHPPGSARVLSSASTPPSFRAHEFGTCAWTDGLLSHSFSFCLQCLTWGFLPQPYREPHLHLGYSLGSPPVQTAGSPAARTAVGGSRRSPSPRVAGLVSARPQPVSISAPAGRLCCSGSVVAGEKGAPENHTCVWVRPWSGQKIQGITE